MPRPPVLGYLQSAVADNTAHSQMDKLLFEDEMSNIQPEWGTMREYQEGYDPAREFAEGMIPVGGVLKKVNIDKIKKYLKYVESKSLFKKGKEPDWWGSGGWGKVSYGQKPLVKHKKSSNPKSKTKNWWEEHEYWNLLNRQEGGPAENDDSSKYDYNRELPHKMPWYTKSILAMMGNELQTPVDWDEEGNVSKVSRHSWSPKGVEQAYNIATDELGFSPDMVNRKNIFLKMLPRETMHYLKTGDITPELIDVRTHLLDMYFDRDSKSQQKLIDSLLEYDKIIDIYTDKGEQFIPKIAHSGLLNPDNLVELFEEKYRDKWYKKPEGKQEGGPAERAPLLGYMNPAVQDETAHSQMDRLMFENELEQQPQHSMRTYQQGYDPAMEWGEGMMRIGGALRLLKGTKDYSKMLKQLSKVADREKKTYEVFEDAARKHGPKIDAGGADKAGKDYLTTKWIQRLLQ